MWSVRVKKRKGFFLWKGDFPVEEGLSALFMHIIYSQEQKNTTNNYLYQPCFLTTSLLYYYYCLLFSAIFIITNL